ncbi:MAG: peptide chain release factor N(5)-glutamine methyltransferase [Candidatus Omnitrophota bacterium]
MLKLQGKTPVLGLIEWAVNRLGSQGNKSSCIEAEIILSFLLKCERIELYLDKHKVLSESLIANFKEIVEKRCLDIPLQYLINEAYFFGLKLFVSKGVFIPRPETEVLVEKILSIIERDFNKQAAILEFCTGSGNISVALTKNAQGCTIIATDINPAALGIAQKNAIKHRVSDKISFLQGDLFSALKAERVSDQEFDIIVANPPYVARLDYDGLPEDVHQEPKPALDGGRDGLVFYRRIISGCAAYLKNGGFIAFEFGDNQKEAIAEIINQSGFFQQPEFFADLNDISRFVTARKKHG